MGKDVDSRLRETENKHRRRITLRSIVGVLCCLVVVGVTYAMILPAITMTADQTLACQYEVHRHDDSCYDADGNLICGLADYVCHTHNPEYCCDSEGNLVCLLDEVQIHEHDESCYIEESVLICGQEESGGHVHEDSCYTLTQGELICESAEEGHEHTNECYEWTMELTCGTAEGEGAHTHDESCFEVQRSLICEKPEVILHTHTDECYEEIFDEEGNIVRRLVCGMLQVEEHQHDESCMITAESEETFAAANMMLFSARLSGTCDGIEYTLTPAAGGGYQLLLSAVDSTTVPSNLLSDKTLSGYIDRISSVEIAAEITGIEANAFSNLTALRTVTFADKSELTTIGAGAFAGCTNLATVNLEKCTSLTTIAGGDTAENGAFAGSGLTEITIPGNVTSIGDFAFYSCKSLSTVNFAENTALTSMGAYVFADCTALESVNPENLKGENLTFGTKESATIGDKTIADGSGLFYGCTALQALTLPNMSGSVAYLCSGCISLTSLNLSACKNLVCDDTSGNANFIKMIDGCTSLETLDLSGLAGMTVFYQGIVGGEIKDDGTIDYSVNSGVKTVILPYTVTRIGHTAFGWSNVEKIIFTKDANENSLLKAVGGTDYNNTQHAHAFAAAQSLKEVELYFDPTESQENLYLQSYAFENCSALERITISSPNGLSVFGTPSFLYGCGKLQELVWDVKSVTTPITWWGGVNENTSQNIRFTIGSNVEVLPAYLMSSLKDNITEYIFSTNHSFYIESAAGVPFTEAGCYYADANGNLYRLKDSTAELVYANRSGSGEFTVPGTITAQMCTDTGRAETDTSFTVTGICSNAFMGTAYGSVTFDKSENITSLGDNAFAGAYNLASINEKTTVEDIKALFASGTTFGSNLFVGTQITSKPFEEPDNPDSEIEAVYPGGETIAATDNIVQISAASDSKITEIQKNNHLATGEPATITVGVSDKSSDNRVRLYIKVSDPNSFTLPTSLSGAEIKTSNADGVYYCDVPAVDQPSTYTLGITCKSNVAPNKKAYVWLLEADSADILTTIGDAVIEPGQTCTNDDGTVTATASSQYIELTWDVLAKEYSVEKKVNEAITPTVKKTDTASTVVGMSFLVSNNMANRETTDDKSYDSYGADYVESVSFVDVLTLPTGLSWKDGLLNTSFSSTINADSTGGSITATIGGKDYILCTLSLASGSLTDLSCAVTDGNPTIKWTTANRDRTTEITAAVTTVTYGPEVIEVDSTSETTEYKLTNTVTATPKYTYSGIGTEKTTTADSSVTSNPSSLTATKEWVKKPLYMGEEAVYKITLDNLADANSIDDVYIHDELDIHQYLAAEEIEKMLLGNGYDSDYLTITINNAVLLPVPKSETVIAVDGETKAQTTVRSAAKTPVYNDLAKEYGYNSATLTMAKAEDGEYISLTVAITGGSTTTYTVGSGKDYENLQTALDSIGYVRSIRGSCVLQWHFKQGTVPVTDNHKEYILHTFVKNTFQVLTEDHNTSIVADVADGSHKYPVSNKLYISKEDYYQDEQRFIQTETVYPTYDLSIDKIAEVGGVSMDTDALKKHMEDTLNNTEGDKSFVIDYSLDIRHYGTGTYGLLPVVDHMTGVQALLAEVEDNTKDGTPSWADYTQTTTIDGKEYYVLNANGAENGTYTYSGVWLENGYADSVTVEKDDNGLDTLIKWYYIDDSHSSYTLETAYKAICSLTYANHVSADLYHFVYNEAWLNDIPTRRLHDNIGAEGASIAFEKHIVTEKGEFPSDDTLWTDKTIPYPLPGEGAKVTYRLDFKNTGSLAIELSGGDFYDVLPAVAVDSDGKPVFTWTKDNVKISYVIVGENVTVSDNTTSGYDIDRQGENSDTYHIRWNNDFKISYPAGVNGEVYIYVTLTFPTGDAWAQYVAAKGSTMLYNSLYVHDVSSRVSHVLPVPGEAMLRKGVYETGYYVIANNVQSSSTEFKRTYQYFRGADRNHYVKTALDSETVKNTVTYFTTVYNSSTTANLYLSPIYDLLPEGFKFYAMVTTPDSTDPTAGYSGSVGLWNQWIGRQGDSVGLTAWNYDPLARPESAESLIKWLSQGDVHNNTVKVRSPYTERMLIFDVTLDDAHKDELGYYLKPGEAIQFGYMCFTGDADVTSADNRCAMEYIDYSSSGVTLTEEKNQTVTVDNNVFTAPANTGAARLITNERAAELGFTQTNPANPATNPQWLISRVSLTEGDIIPGITTKTETYNVESGKPVTWTVTTTNSGTNAMRDYTLTDSIQSPFSFTGKVCYTIFSNNANADSVESKERSNKEVVIAGNGTEDYLFEITAVSDTGVTLVSNKGGEAITVPYGEEKEINVSTRFLQSVAAGGSYEDAAITVSFTKAENGDMTMYIRFADSLWSIPADGASILTVSTTTPEGENSTNGVYVNNATVTPTQTFDAASVNQGTVSTDGKSDSSAASVNIYTGILTTAYKEVSAEGATGISANYGGEGSSDKILLTDKSKEITYTLNVVGAANDNMQKLVVIDTLPQTGDTNPINDTLSRGSQFKVNFAAEPKVTVEVVTKDSTTNEETATTLDSAYYTVWYSTKIGGLGKDTDYTFDETTTPEGWHNDLQEGDRSIRVVINQAIAENETVKISFNAVIDDKGDDTALPGETAWNNFGYSFLSDANMWLYAAPQKVGVTLKSAPVIEKQLVNSAGDAVTAKNDTTFSFVIYKGSGVTFSNNYTADSVATALTGKEYTYATVTVNKDASSGKILLNPAEYKTYTYENGFKPTETGWTWVDGEKYTVVEISGNGEYENTARTYTFTYDQTKNQVISVYNTRHDWSIAITKTGVYDNPLSGAVFGLYSLKENKDISEQFAKYGLPADTPTNCTYDGTTWHLSQLAVSDSSGKLSWEKLSEDKYLVIELKAPDGYILSTDVLAMEYGNWTETPYIVSKSVINNVGVELPQTGGIGTALYTAVGLALTVGALLLLRRRREG